MNKFWIIVSLSKDGVATFPRESQTFATLEDCKKVAAAEVENSRTGIVIMESALEATFVAEPVKYTDLA